MKSTTSLFKSAGTAALMTLGCAAAQAAYLMDTGTPVGVNLWALYPDQSLGATFSLGSATTIRAIEGYIDSLGGAGLVQVDLIAGALPTGATLFSTSAAVSGGESWRNFGGLNWAVGAGTYTVTFASTELLGMRDAAPNPLDPEWFTLGGVWNQADYLDIGVRVSSIPEPQIYALMVAGLVLVVGFAKRRSEKS